MFVNQTGMDNSVISNLKNIEVVKMAFGTFGPYDVIAKIESLSDTKTEHRTMQSIRSIPQIRSTLSLKILEGGFRKTNNLENEVLEKYSMQAYTLIHCNGAHESQIIEDLKKIPEIIEAEFLIGTFEMICRIVAPTYNEISEVISKKIRKLNNVKSTLTLNLLVHQGFQK